MSVRRWADFFAVRNQAIADKSGQRLYATAASATNVAPGGTAEWDAATTAAYIDGMTCSVASVSRRES